eukprot:7828424-Prorocentrum_lima.AAC.1
MTPNMFTTTPVLDLSPPGAKLASAEISIKSCSEELPTTQKQYVCLFGCFACTLAAIAIKQAMSGLVFCASHCKDPTYVCAFFTSS